MIKTKDDIIKELNYPKNIIKVALETFFTENKNEYNLKEVNSFKGFIQTLLKNTKITPHMCLSCGKKYLYEPSDCGGCQNGIICKYF